LNVRQQTKRSNAKEAIIIAPQHLDCRILVKKDDLPKGILKLVSSCSFQYVPWKEPNMESFGAILDLEHLQCLDWCSSLHFQHHKAKPDQITNMEGGTTAQMSFARSPACARL
jgi:hypothetical protein